MKRKDAKQVFDLPAYNKIFPFMLKRRCDSLVYQSYKMDVSATVDFIREYNNAKPEHRMKFFYIFCAALMRTIAVRPELNRFIASKRYWQRNELSMNFVVKEEMSEEAPETSTPLVFRPDMVLDEYAEVIRTYIEKSKERTDDNDTDAMIKLLMHVPYWAIGLFIKIVGGIDKLGKAGSWVGKADGLHTSVFVSNLGSIGIMGGSPYHHLYEWGTTSLFVTLGNLERHREFDNDGKLISSTETIEIGATVDERVSSGYYFVKSMHVLQDFLMHPEKLLERPELPPVPLTKKQWKKKVRSQIREAKAKKREAERAAKFEAKGKNA